MLNLELSELHTVGTSVVASSERSGTGLCSRYALGEHVVVLVDPDVVQVAELGHSGTTTDRALSLDDFQAWASRAGAQALGAGTDFVLGDSQAREHERFISNGEQVDPVSDETIAEVSELLEACTEADRDEAEFDIEDLDPYLVCLRREGRVVALAGARNLEERPPFFDIGVLTHPAWRTQGLGRAAVAQVVALVLADGCSPLYRCDITNVGSRGIALSLGFGAVAHIEAVRIDAASIDATGA